MDRANASISCQTDVYNTQFGTLSSTLRRSSTQFSSSSSTLPRPSKQRPGIYTTSNWNYLRKITYTVFVGTSSSSSLRNSRLSSVSESESEWRSASIIVQNPLAVILEEREVGLQLSDIGESDYEESVFGDDDMQSGDVIKVNLAAVDIK